MADIDIKVGASGVSQFKQQMNQAAGAVKGINAELKLAEAQYQATGNQQQYLAEKSELLKKQLEEQKKSVAAAEKALAAVEKQYGKNSSQANAWRTKLVQAKTALVQTETAIHKTDSALDALAQDDVSGVARDLGKVGDEAKKADTAADDLAESVGGIAQKLDRETIIRGLDAVADKMKAVITTAFNMGKAIWQASLDAATWGDETRDNAVAAALTTTRYQQAAYAAQFFGSSIESLTAAQPKLVKAIKGAENGVIEIGDSLVNTMEWVSDGNGGFVRQERSWLDVMLDTVDALGEISSETEKESIAMALFGKSYKDYMGLFGNTDAFRRKEKQAPVVSEKDVDNLADANDEVKDMNAQLETLKLTVLAALAPDIKLIAGAVGDLAKSFNEFLATDEGQKLLTDIGTSISDIVRNLTGDVNFESIVSAAATALDDFKKALEWLSQHKDEVVTAIKAVIGSLLGLKMLSGGLKLTNGILSLQGLLPGKNGTPAPTTTGSGGTPTVTGVAPGSSNPFGLATAPLAGAVLAMAAKNYGNAKDTINRLDGEADAIREVAEATGQASDAYADLIKVGTNALESKIIGNGVFGPIWGENHTAEREAIETFKAAGLEGVLSPETYAELMSQPSTGASNRALVQKITEELAAIKPAAVDAGESLGDGLDEGMQNTEGTVADTAGGLAGGAMDSIKEVLAIHSPSKAMAALGQFAGLGFAEGIAGSIGAVTAAAASLAYAANDAFNSALSIVGRVARPAIGGASTYNANSSMYIGTYNQNSGGDATVLAAQVAAAQRAARRSFGARK